MGPRVVAKHNPVFILDLAAVIEKLEVTKHQGPSPDVWGGARGIQICKCAFALGLTFF